MKMKCPFCKASITFEKIIEGEVHPCPVCNHPIKMEHITCWQELKSDCKDVCGGTITFLESKHKWVTGIMLALLLATCLIWWTTPTLVSLGIVIGIFLLGWMACQPGFWKAIGYLLLILIAIALLFTPVGWFILLVVFLCWVAGNSRGQVITGNTTKVNQSIRGNNNHQTSQTAYGNNNFNTYNFTFHSATPPRIVKCAHCGASRPDVMDSCPGCGSRNVK